MSDFFELQDQQRMSREDAAKRLHAIADQLERHNDLEFERNGISIKAKVPDEVHLKVEFEVDGDGTEMEIELTW
ncbi:MAG: amphi-Trp domain-containing protein [Solirubrobacteraceae bacterium]|nr:amphi-Trp domain-containing protein [Solirubrobacteraceae bacterium]